MIEEKDIKPESTFIEGPGADSGLVTSLSSPSKKLEIDIPDEDTEKIRTNQDAIDYIGKHAAEVPSDGRGGVPHASVAWHTWSHGSSMNRVVITGIDLVTPRASFWQESQWTRPCR